MLVRPIPRRMLLRGAGACMALPLLEAMTPRRAAAAEGGLRNLIVLFLPNGVDTAQFHPPVGPLTADTLTAPMQDLVGHPAEGIWPAFESVVDEITVVSGIDHSPISQDIHVCSMALAAHVDRDGSRTPPEPTLDQVLSAHLASDTAVFPNLAMSGTADTAVTQGYLSFRSGGQVDPGYRAPRDVFEALFSGGGAGDPEAQRRIARRASVIDAVLDDAHRLERRLGAADRQRLDQYLESVYEVEGQLQASDRCEGVEAPAGGSDMHTKAKHFMDLTLLAVSCGLTHVATIQYSNSWDLGYAGIELGEGIGDWSDHFISHKLGDQDRATDLDGLPQAEAMRIANARVELTTRFKMRRLGNLLEALRNTPTPTGTMLDETLVLYTSENADGDSHSRVNMPIVLAGGSAGGFRTGRVVSAGGAPTGALHASILGLFGMEVESWGDPAAPPIADL